MTVQAWVVLKTLSQDPLTPRYRLEIPKQTDLAPSTIGGVLLVVKKLLDAGSQWVTLRGGSDSLVDHPLLRR